LFGQAIAFGYLVILANTIKLEAATIGQMSKENLLKAKDFIQ
jgi:hypothetical protein